MEACTLLPNKYKIIAETYWRAAMEKVLKVVIEESDGPSNPKDLMAWMHNELE